MKVVYVAGPFRAATPWLQELNVRAAEAAALELWQNGIVAVCPHTQTRFYQHSAPDEVWLEGTLEMLRRCDAIFVLPDWQRSQGTQGEIREAQRLMLPVFQSVPGVVAWAEST